MGRGWRMAPGEGFPDKSKISEPLSTRHKFRQPNQRFGPSLNPSLLRRATFPPEGGKQLFRLSVVRICRGSKGREPLVPLGGPGRNGTPRRFSLGSETRFFSREKKWVCIAAPRYAKILKRTGGFRTRPYAF